MKQYKLIWPFDVSFRNWLFRNVGPIDDFWYVTHDNRLTFKRGADAMYFCLMFPYKVDTETNTIDWYSNPK